MKLKYVIGLLISILTGTDQISAQSPIVKTPLGQQITITTPPDTYSSARKQAISDSIAEAYPDAIELNAPSASTAYNCHSYAWNMSEGGPACNISRYNSGPYWLNGSYEEVTNPELASKIFYYDDDHTGIITDDGYIISKWGELPLMKHRIDDGPEYYCMDGTRVYYRLKQPVIQGSQSPLCEGQERVFNSDIRIDGSTYSWAIPSYLLDEVSKDANTITVEPVSGGARGWLQVQITTPSGEVTTTSPSYYFHVGVPYSPSEIYGDYDFCPSLNYYFSVDDPYNSNVTYDWDVIGDAYLTYGQGSSPVEIYTTQPGSFYLTVAAYNTCGFSDDLYSNTYYISSYCKSGMFILYPNPAKDNIKIELTEEPSEEVILNIYNSQLIKVISISMNSKEKTIDISKLQKGVYHVTTLSKINGKGKINTGNFIKE